MMKRIQHVIIFGMIAGFLCIASAAVFIQGYYLPYKPCRPIAYSSGQTIGLGRTMLDSETPFRQVVAFYDQRLLTIHEGRWRKIADRVDAVTYACEAVDLNGLTAETGCVYLSNVAGSAHIILELQVYEGSTVPCQGP